MSEEDLVQEARELLASVPKARPWHAHSVFIPEYSSTSDGYDKRRSVTAEAAIVADAYSEPVAKLIARAPELLSTLCDEVERLGRERDDLRTELEEKNYMSMFSQTHVGDD